MKLKGNYFWFFALQLVSGIIAYPLMVKFGVFLGIFLSYLPFFAGLITTHVNYKPDERDMQLIHKTDSFHSMLLMVAMAIIYLYFPSINWFFAMCAGISIFRGATGLIIFATN
jgi:hypothetical protein